MTYPNFLSCFALGFSSSFFGRGLLFEKVHGCNCFGAGADVNMDRTCMAKNGQACGRGNKKNNRINARNQQTHPLLQSLCLPFFYFFFVGLSKIKPSAIKMAKCVVAAGCLQNESMQCFSLSSATEYGNGKVLHLLQSCCCSVCCCLLSFQRILRIW